MVEGKLFPLHGLIKSTHRGTQPKGSPLSTPELWNNGHAFRQKVKGMGRYIGLVTDYSFPRYVASQLCLAQDTQRPFGLGLEPTFPPMTLVTQIAR